ncbi:hypothetical protein LCGC14_2168460 [marine sediment metagenome]|uniref:Uncharacterized protein n=1 Tax=marine sediment metagenome TaxID=412755 RepID=A0A0F9G3E7_9ZZZZ
MDKAITLTIQVIARMGTRSTSYNVKDIERALLQVDLTPVRDGVFFTAEQVYSNKADTITARKQIETALQRVHRNVAYRFSFS